MQLPGFLDAHVSAVILLLLLVFLIRLRLRARRVPGNGRVVIISGCDSGFGHMLANQLFQRDSLKPFLQPLLLDITNETSVARAVEVVSSRCSEIHAVVNNAGIGTAGPLEWMPLQLTHDVISVNFLGHVAMTKAFFPLLAHSASCGHDPRVVNISSLAGLVGVPNMSIYCASKWALEGWSDSIRREFRLWGIKVVVIEPGFMRTPILANAKQKLDDLWRALPSHAQERWGIPYRQVIRIRAHHLRLSHVIQAAERKMLRVESHVAQDPQVLHSIQTYLTHKCNFAHPLPTTQVAVNKIIDAVTLVSPDSRYRAGRDAQIIHVLLKWLPTQVVDWLLELEDRRRMAPPAFLKQQAAATKQS